MSFGPGDFCKTCIYFADHDGPDKPGICRRYPPSILQRDDGMCMTSFPRVNSDMICGEHQDRDRII
jgi:hypothetical protein